MILTNFERNALASIKFFTRKNKSLNKEGFDLMDLMDFEQKFRNCFQQFLKNPTKKKKVRINVLRHIMEMIDVFAGNIFFCDFRFLFMIYVMR